jgi:hypothetical protein
MSSPRLTTPFTMLTKSSCAMAASEVNTLPPAALPLSRHNGAALRAEFKGTTSLLFVAGPIVAPSPQLWTRTGGGACEHIVRVLAAHPLAAFMEAGRDFGVRRSPWLCA